MGWATSHDYVIMISSAKPWTINHTCLPCLPSERTLLFLSDLFVVGRVVSWERWESSELRRKERRRVVSWKGGKGV